jgi:hypothetical protein
MQEVPRLNFDLKRNNLNKEGETWWLTLKEEHRLSVFKSGVLRKIFGTKRDEVTREWRRLHSEEINDLYCSPNITGGIKSRVGLAEHVACISEKRRAYTVLVGKHEGNKYCQEGTGVEGKIILK